MGLRERCELPQRGPRGILEEVDFCVFWVFKNLQLLFTRYSPVIFTANFSDFAFVLGMTVLTKLGLNHNWGGVSQSRCG